MENPSRFVIFLVLAFTILMAHAMLTQILFPPKDLGPPVALDQAAPNEPAGAQAAAERPGEAGPPDAAAPVAAAPDAAESDAAESAAEPAAAAEPAPVDHAAGPEEEPQEHAEQWVALGSLDASPQNRFRMQVVFTTRGAAIYRAALADPKYRDVDDRSGFLGYLAPTNPSDAVGCLIRVVGDGTPAAVAGLEPGDVITGLDQAEIRSAEDLRLALQQTRPGQQIRLTVRRGDASPRQCEAELERRPMDVMRPERENLLARGVTPPVDLVDPPSLLLTFEQINGERLDPDEQELVGVELTRRHWQLIERDDTQVAFRITLPKRQLEIVKRFRLARASDEPAAEPARPAYHLDVTLQVRNLADHQQAVAYRLDGPTGLPTEGWWYANKIGRHWFESVGLRDLIVRFQGAECELFGCASIADGEVEPLRQSGPEAKSLMYAGVDGQYFSAVLLPRKEELSDLWLAETQAVRIGAAPEVAKNKRLTNVTCRLISRTVQLEPRGIDGQTLEHHYQLFVGPKRPRLLAAYGQEQDMTYNLKDLVYYGWFWWVAVPMLAVLHTFGAVLGNYGIAIILLTVLVRGAMFPLSLKQTRNMKKMQELQPEIKRLAEKYKGDAEKRTRAQQELFRKHNYNPMGGCLVMFFQLPVFVGLYRSLMVDVELRQAPLLGDAIRWCSNLAAPDMLMNWTAFAPTFLVGMLGPYLNVLPLVTVGIFLWQQTMFMPPPADEQAALQQKMMKYMMVFIGFMFFKVASGLCLYFIASSVWGIAERKLLPNAPAPGSPGAAEPAAVPARSGPNGQPRGAARKKQKSRRK